ncbi:RING-H2 finger protein ATL64-like [Dendrobium catenatum]|uniref:RING-H2 finger protein ATL60 n=1 Tax=Dendrobium catenatum TaxID=906689 RepID=A0A2I0WG68_9ASPA|nr:RING-H2 finger protein ATL64-like [Dendrobium catenatum]PKU74670.1 RING-H2 finger protein ATL60 [Dendrobium catenatum]
MATLTELNNSDPSVTLSNIFPIKIVLPGVAVLSILFLIVLMIYFRVKNQSDPISSSRVALDTAILNALPITVFSSTESECAICLADLADGELGRLLPQCNHGFHQSCIDKWFLVNSTCPTCRSPVDPPQKLPASYYGTKSVTLVMEAENTDIKEGTLQPKASSTTAEVEISASEHRTEEIRSPAMGSLGWLRRMVSSACSSRVWDVEQGQGGVAGGRN